MTYKLQVEVSGLAARVDFSAKLFWNMHPLPLSPARIMKSCSSNVTDHPMPSFDIHERSTTKARPVTGSRTRRDCTRQAPHWDWSRRYWWPTCSAQQTSSAASTWAWWRWIWCSGLNPPQPSPSLTRACEPFRPAGGDKHFGDWWAKTGAILQMNYWVELIIEWTKLAKYQWTSSVIQYHVKG